MLTRWMLICINYVDQVDVLQDLVLLFCRNYVGKVILFLH